jgi:hypothetical protein
VGGFRLSGQIFQAHKMIADEPLPKSAGRPEFEPTESQRETVANMVACGITQEQIALFLDIDGNTLRKHFRREIDTAATVANAKVGKSLFVKATSGDVGAMVWWTKTRMGWKEKQEIAHTDADGNNLGVVFIPAGKNGADAG